MSNIVNIADKCPLPASIEVNKEWFAKRDQILADTPTEIDGASAFAVAEVSLKLITRHSNGLDKQRLDFQRPVRTFIEGAKKITDAARLPMEEAKQALKGKIAAHLRKVQADANAAAEAQAQAEADAQKQAEIAANPFAAMVAASNEEPTPAPAPAPITKTNLISTKEVWKWEIEDLTKIPREFLEVNTKMINATVKASKGATNIPGITVRPEMAIQSR